MRKDRRTSFSNSSTFALDEDIVEASVLEKLQDLPERSSTAAAAAALSSSMGSSSNTTKRSSFVSSVSDLTDIDSVVAELTKWADNSASGYTVDLNSEDHLKLAVKGCSTALALAQKFSPTAILEQYAGIDCSALKEYTGNANKSFDAAIIGTTLSSMEKYSYVATVQGGGLDAIERFCTSNDTSCTEVYKQGGIPVILTAMKMNRKNAEMQCAACKCLTALAKTVGKEAQLDILQENGLSHIAKACQDHLENVATIQAASAALKMVSSVLDGYH